jgi:hypothetical protein
LRTKVILAISRGAAIGIRIDFGSRSFAAKGMYLFGKPLRSEANKSTKTFLVICREKSSFEVLVDKK